MGTMNDRRGRAIHRAHGRSAGDIVDIARSPMPGGRAGPTTLAIPLQIES